MGFDRCHGNVEFISDLFVQQAGHKMAKHHALLRVVVEVSTYEQTTSDFWRGLMKRFTDAMEDRIAMDQAAHAPFCGLLRPKP